MTMHCHSPWRPCRPRRTLVPQRVQGVDHIAVAAATLAPILDWLALRAIRVAAKRGRRHGIQFIAAGCDSSPLSWLAGRRRSFKQSIASRQMACPGSRCGSTLERACVPVP